MQFEISNKITDKTIELKENLTQQSECKRDLCCFEIPYNEFMINGGFNEGNAMFRNVARIALDAFDAYCDIQINKITLSNISNITIKIRNKYDKINDQLFQSCAPPISLPLQCLPSSPYLNRGLPRKNFFILKMRRVLFDLLPHLHRPSILNRQRLNNSI